MRIKTQSMLWKQTICSFLQGEVNIVLSMCGLNTKMIWFYNAKLMEIARKVELIVCVELELKNWLLDLLMELYVCLVKNRVSCNKQGKL